jgi:hypothetical protein
MRVPARPRRYDVGKIGLRIHLVELDTETGASGGESGCIELDKKDRLCGHFLSM